MKLYRLCAIVYFTDQVYGGFVPISILSYAMFRFACLFAFLSAKYYTVHLLLGIHVFVTAEMTGILLALKSILTAITTDTTVSFPSPMDVLFFFLLYYSPILDIFA